MNTRGGQKDQQKEWFLPWVNDILFSASLNGEEEMQIALLAIHETFKDNPDLGFKYFNLFKFVHEFLETECFYDDFHQQFWKEENKKQELEK